MENYAIAGISFTVKWKRTTCIVKIHMQNNLLKQ